MLLTHELHWPWADGAASIAVGLLLCTVAIFLATETRSLLVGESADWRTVRDIRDLAARDPAVVGVAPPLTMHLAPRRILVNLSIAFHSSMSGDEIIAAIGRIEDAIRAQHPDVATIFVEAITPSIRRGD